MTKSALLRARPDRRTGRSFRSPVPCAPRARAPAAALVVLLGVMLDVSILHAAPSYTHFFGDYEGTAISDTGGELEQRDLRVKIGPIDDGFYVSWVVVTQRTEGEVKRKEHRVDFRPSGRANIFRSAMRTNMFGQAVPHDPMRGDPYVWARIDQDTLTVHALIIREDGGYELQVYNRTLTDQGMTLKYRRIRDGEILRTVNGALTRR